MNIIRVYSPPEEFQAASADPLITVKDGNELKAAQAKALHVNNCSPVVISSWPPPPAIAKEAPDR